LLVFPGIVDAHTHFWEPADELLEGFASGGAGAVAGGVTTVVEMPHSDPMTILGDEFIEKRQLVQAHAIADMALWGGVVGAPAQSSVDVEAMAAEGAVAFMSAMASRNRSFPEVNDAQLHDAMRVIAELGLPYGIHAENDDLVEAGIARMAAEERTDPLAHADSRPPLVETVAVSTVLQLAEATG
jgi:dihydroorotase-like cyclic amidohydrolase